MNVRLQILSANKLAESLGNGAPAEIRTRDPRLRRPVLYPTELRARAPIVAGPAEAGHYRYRHHDYFRLRPQPSPTDIARDGVQFFVDEITPALDEMIWLCTV